jgi:Transglycosylase
MRTAVTWIVRSIALLLSLAILAPVVLYLFGLMLLPSDRKPDDPGTVPPMARDLLWRELGGEGPPAMPPLSPYTEFFRVSVAGKNLAIAAGRGLLKQGGTPRPWMPALYSAALWTSRNWSAEQALTTILVRSYYGHDLYGLDAAARAYFGLPASSLTPFETAQLVALTRSSSRYDPWCATTASRTRATEISGREVSESPSRLRSPPEGACS